MRINRKHYQHGIGVVSNSVISFFSIGQATSFSWMTHLRLAFFTRMILGKRQQKKVEKIKKNISLTIPHHGVNFYKFSSIK
jgi:hypothetical protein